MTITSIILALLIGYIFGCFQTSYFISMKFKKKDIRDIGSGNAGASNITSEMGWAFGILTGFCDILKAYLPVKIIIIIFTNPLYQLDYMILAGTGAILGHIFPFFINFRGGKGIACYIGMLIGVDWQIGLLAGGLIIILTIITDFIAVGSISLYVIMPILAYYNGNSNIIIICSIILFLVGIIKHWINVQRILNGNEKGLRSVIYKND